MCLSRSGQSFLRLSRPMQLGLGLVAVSLVAGLLLLRLPGQEVPQPENTETSFCADSTSAVDDDGPLLARSGCTVIAARDCDRRGAVIGARAFKPARVVATFDRSRQPAPTSRARRGDPVNLRLRLQQPHRA